MRVLLALAVATVVTAKQAVIHPQGPQVHPHPAHHPAAHKAAAHKAAAHKTKAAHTTVHNTAHTKHTVVSHKAVEHEVHARLQAAVHIADKQLRGTLGKKETELHAAHSAEDHLLKYDHLLKTSLEKSSQEVLQLKAKLSQEEAMLKKHLAVTQKSSTAFKKAADHATAAFQSKQKASEHEVVELKKQIASARKSAKITIHKLEKKLKHEATQIKVLKHAENVHETLKNAPIKGLKQALKSAERVVAHKSHMDHHLQEKIDKAKTAFEVKVLHAVEKDTKYLAAQKKAAAAKKAAEALAAAKKEAAKIAAKKAAAKVAAKKQAVVKAAAKATDKAKNEKKFNKVFNKEFKKDSKELVKEAKEFNHDFKLGIKEVKTFEKIFDSDLPSIAHEISTETTKKSALSDKHSHGDAAAVAAYNKRAGAVGAAALSNHNSPSHKSASSHLQVALCSLALPLLAYML